ncbi:MAG: hypothetical protein VW802_06310 [Rhodospirillaceae bacterium]|jgi:hypothetical protein
MPNRPPPRYHDLGGQDAGPIEMEEHTIKPWVRRSDAVKSLLSDKKRRFLTTDETRHELETMGENLYFGLEYGERRMIALMNVLTNKGLLSQEEIDQKIEEIYARLGIEKKIEKSA